ncbi:glycosyltransferase family 4 protein [Rhizobium azibense]|uniref:Glycosyltransferase involved in cell wall biosynthesis n=1 Tax=Rhizobium azibense TaxID=1136135 RepID=A0A4R3S0Z9_9HYPH|nr:glycosyltransferase family 4 protein [Rhizobium azibense]TCU40889.1 glycosyltransferase involved in cell wall biosynthesis [Rhizobium azibense]
MRLIVVNDVSVVQGGATKVAIQCLQACARAAMDCTFFVGDDGTGLEEYGLRLPTIALGERPLRDGPVIANVFDRHFNKRAYEALSMLLARSSEKTVVHVHGWNQILSPSIFHALAESPARVIVTAHDFFLNCPNGGRLNYRSGEICPVKPMSLECLATNCDKRNYLHKLWRFRRMLGQIGVGDDFWQRIEVILAHEKMEAYLTPGPVRNFQTLRTPTEPLTRRPTEPWRHERIMFLGRMTWEKGVRTLGEALRMTNQAATLIGRGPLLEEMQVTLPNCWVPGWLDHETVAELADQARIFVMPSRMPEPYGLVAAEAIMSGIPVIISSNALIADEIEQNRAGLVFKSGDAASLAEALLKVKSDSLVQKLAEGARAFGNKIAPSRVEWERRMIAIYAGEAAFLAA